jgi:NDP-sugar pyrophosphorylase family protein
LINAGVYLFCSNLITQFPPHRPLSLETDVFPYLLTQGIKIQVCSATGPFLDIGTEETFRQADDFITSNMGRFS